MFAGGGRERSHRVISPECKQVRQFGLVVQSVQTGAVGIDVSQKKLREQAEQIESSIVDAVTQLLRRGLATQEKESTYG